MPGERLETPSPGKVCCRDTRRLEEPARGARPPPLTMRRLMRLRRPRRLLALLHVLDLPRLPLSQMLRLLLVPLFHLLLPLLVGVLTCELLILLHLLLFELLPRFFLLSNHLLLLLLVLLIELGIARIGRSGTADWRKIASMDRFGTRLRRLNAVVGVGIHVGMTSGIRRPLGRMVRSAGFLGALDAVAFELARARSGRDRRLASIERGTQVAIATGELTLLRLRVNGPPVAPMSRGFFLGIGTSNDAAATSVVTDVIDCDICDGFPVDVVDDGDVDVADFTVVIEAIAIPAAADIADAEVTEAVIYAAIEAH